MTKEIEEYLENKKMSVSYQTEKWTNMTKGFWGSADTDELDTLISSEKNELFDHYDTLSRLLNKIKDPEFVNNEFVNMFEKIIELAEFNDGKRIGLDKFVVKRYIVQEHTARWMAIMWSGIATKDNIVDSEQVSTEQRKADFFRIENLYIGNGITELNWLAPSLYNLVNVVFQPESKCTQIGFSSFERCDRLKQIIIPDSVITIGKHCFQDCYDLSNVVIGKNVTEIGEYAFHNLLS